MDQVVIRAVRVALVCPAVMMADPAKAMADLDQADPDQADPDQADPDQADPDQADPDQALALVRVDTAAQVTRGELEEQPDLACPGPGAWRVPAREVPAREVTAKEVPGKEVPAREVRAKEVPARPVVPLSRLVRPLLEVLAAAPDQAATMAVREVPAVRAVMTEAPVVPAVRAVMTVVPAAPAVRAVMTEAPVVPVAQAVVGSNQQASWVRSDSSLLVASTLAVAK